MKIDWPEWLKGCHIARDQNGDVWVYYDEPEIDFLINGFNAVDICSSPLHPELFDLSFLPQEWWALDWKDSLIQKPVKEATK